MLLERENGMYLLGETRLALVAKGTKLGKEKEARYNDGMDETNAGPNLSFEALQRRLGPPDTVQIRLLLKVSPAQRLKSMLDMQAVILNTWHARLRQAHPELTDLELCRLLFKRLQQND